MAPVPHSCTQRVGAFVLPAAESPLTEFSSSREDRLATIGFNAFGYVPKQRSNDTFPQKNDHDVLDRSDGVAVFGLDPPEQRPELRRGSGR